MILVIRGAISKKILYFFIRNSENHLFSDKESSNWGDPLPPFGILSKNIGIAPLIVQMIQQQKIYMFLNIGSDQQ